MPIIKIHNVETDEIIEREMNTEELAQLELAKARNVALAQELKEKTEKRQALLERLGITEEEAKLLLGGI